MIRTIHAVSVIFILCLVPVIGFLYTASQTPAVELEANAVTFRPPSLFDGEDVYTNGRWFLLGDGRLADLDDGRVYVTDLEFAPFQQIETDGNRLLADGNPVYVYRTAVYPNLGTLNREYETLRTRFPDAVIAAVSTLHLAAVSNGQLYTFADEGKLSVFRVNWKLHGDRLTLFEQICLFYEHPEEFFSNDHYYIADGGDLRCFDTTFGELGIS